MDASLTAEQRKREGVLDAALSTFGRYGYQKTSMETVARAAGISRPSLYLLYNGKEQLYRATMARLLDRTHAAARDRLADETIPFRLRLTQALDEWMGRYVESAVARDISSLLENSEAQLGAMFADSQAGLLADLTAAIERSAPPGLSSADRSAADIAAVLFGAANTWKHEAADRADFRRRVEMTVRVVCAPACDQDHA